MSEMQDPINERINFLITEFEGGVRRRFALKIGVSAGMISDLFSERKNKPGIDMVRKILVAYPQISTSWLLLGEGEMLKAAPQTDTPQNNLSYMHPSAGQNSVAAGMELGPPVAGEEWQPNYHTPAPKRPKATPNPELPGLDLVRTVARLDSEMKEVRAQLAALQQQPTTT